MQLTRRTEIFSIMVVLLILIPVIAPMGELAVQAQDSTEIENMPADGDDQPTFGNFNLPIKTAGGVQFWTDCRNRGGYRVQHNSLTGHWRLLDPGDVRRAWGTKPQCLLELERYAPHSQMVVDPPQHVVVLLHGLMRTHHSMSQLATALDQANFDNTLVFSYASTRQSIGENAAALREILDDLPASTTFSFIGHSMGNIVVRHLIGDLQTGDDQPGLLGRMRAMVMLGPPNQGAAIARRLAKTGVFGLVAGKGGMELGPEFEELQKKLATPPFPFAIIAGDVSDRPVQNPLVDGAGDFVVSLKEAQLDGAEEIKSLPNLHSFLMDDPDVQHYCVDFLDRHCR